MSDPGIEATFVDIDDVATRKQVKLVFEAPVEMADAILERLGGWPRKDDPQWCMIVPFKRPDAPQ